MLPTLLDGDKVWVNKLAYDVKIPFTEISLAEVSDPKHGDIVIIDSKVADKRLVKRIVGICLLYTSPRQRDQSGARMTSSA